MGQVLQAKESFVTEVDGRRTIVVAGQTRIDSQHELASRYPDYFEEIKATYGVESATDNPGEVRTRVATAQAEAAAEASSEEASAETEGSKTKPSEASAAASKSSGGRPKSTPSK